MIDDAPYLWLWLCSECGAVWLGDTDDDRVQECPADQSNECNGAGYCWLIEDDTTKSMAWLVNTLPDDLIPLEGVTLWPDNEGWDTLIVEYPVIRKG